MPNIKSSADLQNDYSAISTFCHESREPVFITKNGQGDLAVMSIDVYETITKRLYSLFGSSGDQLYRLFVSTVPPDSPESTVEERVAALQEIRDVLKGIDGSDADVKEIREERRMAKYGHYF